MQFDTIIRGGTVVTAADTTRCDIGIRGGRIAALGIDLGEAVGGQTNGRYVNGEKSALAVPSRQAN